MKPFTALYLCFFLLISSVSIPGMGYEVHNHTSSVLYPHQSIRNSLADAVVVSDSDPYFSLISTSVACWYDNETNTTGLLPLLVHHEGSLTDSQTRFFEKYLDSIDRSLLILGDHLQTSYQTIEILGSPAAVSLLLATSVFSVAPDVLIIPYGGSEAYQLSLLAAPLASYLNIPILIFDNNEVELQTVCTQLQTTHAYLVGNLTLNLENVSIIPLQTEVQITDMILTVIKEQFGSLSYLVMTNPSDVVPPSVINTTDILFTDHIVNKKIIILGKEFDIVGNDTRTYTFLVPEWSYSCPDFWRNLSNTWFFSQTFLPGRPTPFHDPDRFERADCCLCQ